MSHNIFQCNTGEDYDQSEALSGGSCSIDQSTGNVQVNGNQTDQTWFPFLHTFGQAENWKIPRARIYYIVSANKCGGIWCWKSTCAVDDLLQLPDISVANNVIGAFVSGEN